MSAIPIEIQEHAVFWVTLPERIPLSLLEAHLDELIERASHQPPRVLVRDATLVDPRTVTPSHRKLGAAHFRRLEQEGIAPELEVLVLPNPVLRGVLTAITWAFKPSWRREVVKTVADARMLVDGHIAQARSAVS